MAKKPVPDALCDVELEKRVLGGVMADPDVVLPLSRVLLPDDLFDVKNRAVYEVQLQLLEEKVRPTVDNVRCRVIDLGWERRVGGVAYVAELAQQTIGLGPSPSLDVPVWGERLSKLADKRALFQLGDMLQEKAEVIGSDPEEIWNEVITMVVTGKKKAAVEYRTLGSVVRNAMELVWAWMRGENPAAVPTGFDSVDYALGGGLYKGQLTILGGRPGSGKTLMAENIMSHAASLGYSVAMSSIEMKASDLVVRDLCRRAYLDGLKLRRGEYAGDDEAIARMKEAERELGSSEVLVCDRSEQSAAEMHYAMMILALERGGIDLHVVDYVELMGDVRGEGGEDDDRTGVVMALRRLKALCKSVDCAELVISQLSRAGARMPRLSTLMWGGEPIADAVLMSFWPWKLMKQGELRRVPSWVLLGHDGGPVMSAWYLLVEKHRYAKEARIRLVIEPDIGVFSDPPGVILGGSHGSGNKGTAGQRF